MWSAAVDPRVLRARAVAASEPDTGSRTVLASVMRRVRSGRAEHLLIDRGEYVRLDILHSGDATERSTLHFDLPDDEWLEERVTVIRALRSSPSVRRHPQLAQRLLCLHAIDVRDAGRSLKEIAARVLGPGDWPGDGEHRKSMTRRLIAAGERMLLAGPPAVLAGRHRTRR